MERMQAVRQLKGGEEISSSYIVRNLNVRCFIYSIWLDNSYVQSAALKMFLLHALMIMSIFNRVI